MVHRLKITDFKLYKTNFHGNSAINKTISTIKTSKNIKTKLILILVLFFYFFLGGLRTAFYGKKSWQVLAGGRKQKRPPFFSKIFRFQCLFHF